MADLTSHRSLGAFGFWHLSSVFSTEEIAILRDHARACCTAAPLATPTMRDGTPLKVRVTSFGDAGWWADREGYRYVDHHPQTAEPWPPIPVRLRSYAEKALAAAASFGAAVDPTSTAAAFDTCLLNYYQPGSSLGWHQDLTERDRRTPILGISIGDPAVFEIALGEAEYECILENGDVVLMAGPARLARHRIASIVRPGLFSTPSPLTGPGRISFTFRRCRPLEAV